MRRVAPARRQHSLPWLALLLAGAGASSATGAEVRYDLSARAAFNARTPYPGETTAPVDLEVTPVGDVSLLSGTTTRLRLQYLPTLLLRPSPGPALLQRGQVEFAYLRERFGLSLSQSGAFGVTDVSPLRMGETLPAGSVGQGQVLFSVPVVRSDSQLTLSTRPVDRFSLSLTAGYSISGSPTSSALPLQRGPTGSVSFRVTATRQDALVTLVHGSWARFVNGQENVIVFATESWERRVAPSAVLTVGGGAAFTREVIVPVPQGPRPGTYQEILPVAVASLGWRETIRGSPATLNVSARLSPFADRFTGTVYERVEARFTGDWRADREWSVTTGGALGIGVPIGATSALERVLGAEGTVSWAAARWLTVAVSLRAAVSQVRGSETQVQVMSGLSAMVREHDSTAW